MLWKGNQLAFAGRVTLSKSVMEVMPIYPMMKSINQSLASMRFRVCREILSGVITLMEKVSCG